MPELNMATLHEAIAARVPDRECLVWGDRRFTWADVTERTRRLANGLIDRGLGAVTPRSELENHESGQDHLALYLIDVTGHGIDSALLAVTVTNVIRSASLVGATRTDGLHV